MPSALPSRKGMNARLQFADINRANHGAGSVGDRRGDFVGRLLQLNAKRRGGGGRVAFGGAGARRIVVPGIITP